MLDKIKKFLSVTFSKKKVLVNVIGFLVVLLPTLIYASIEGLLVDLPVILIAFFGGLFFEKLKKLVYEKILKS